MLHSACFFGNSLSAQRCSVHYKQNLHRVCRVGGPPEAQTAYPTAMVTLMIHIEHTHDHDDHANREQSLYLC